MQSTFHLPSSSSFPLSVSGITQNGLSISQEIADHEGRREAMRRQRSQARKRIHSNREMDSGRRSQVRDYLEEEEKKVTNKELDDDDDFSNRFVGFTAKAA